MRFPQEVVVQTFLPTYRALLARSLSKEGLSQEEIADNVGVTQAQVSKYLGGKLDLEPRIAEDPRVLSTVEEVAAGLAEGRLDVVTALAKSLELIRRLENRGPLCELHAERMPALEGTGCDACIEPSSRVISEHQVLVDLRLALRRLVLVDGFTAWVPHVGSNLAQAIEGAEGPWDVAALPGRIDAVGGTASVTTEPSFGASRHVATVVLAVMQAYPGHRGALNLAYRPEIVEKAQAAGVEHASFDPDYEGRQAEVARRVEAAGSDQAPPGLLYHEGAFGIEPVAYLVGTDAPSVVERLETLVTAEP